MYAMVRYDMAWHGMAWHGMYVCMYVCTYVCVSMLCMYGWMDEWMDACMHVCYVNGYLFIYKYTYSYFCITLGNARIAEKCIKLMINDRIRKKCSNGSKWILQCFHPSPRAAQLCTSYAHTIHVFKVVNGFVFGASEY